MGQGQLGGLPGSGLPGDKKAEEKKEEKYELVALPTHVKDYLLMEEQFVTNHEQLKPRENKNEEDHSKVNDLRGSLMSVGNLEEIINENHAIVSSSVGLQYYVNILSFVDKDQLEPGCAILMHNKG
ncbi:unnamed protein product [Calypogeia fissa]